MDITGRLAEIRREIEAARQRSGRTDSPVIIAVTKTWPADILPAVQAAGITAAGENYVQELVAKLDVAPGLEWHFIGGLQRNKAKYIVGRVAMIHSVDSFELAAEIEKRATARGTVQDVLVQVNQGEATKGGVPVADVPRLVEGMNNLRHVRLRGLMAMPPPADDPEASRPYFRQARELLDILNRAGVYREHLTLLSMGMSGDYAVAVEEGATHLRIGSALLGERA